VKEREREAVDDERIDRGNEQQQNEQQQQQQQQQQ